MLFLEAEDPDKDIQLYINSPGGEVTSGLMIYDTMQYIKADVQTICMGMAASMGAFCWLPRAGQTLCFAQCGDHDSPAFWRRAGSGHRHPDCCRTHSENERALNRILSERTGQPFEKVAADTERDNWMTAEDARAYGIIDLIMEKRA
jgi:ATP-dependent Clp protease protease subunit